MPMLVDPTKCPQDHRCPAIDECPRGAISQENDFALPQIDATQCTLCEICMDVCPKGAFYQIPGNSR